MSTINPQERQYRSKADRIDAVQAKLPLPEDPPTAPDWNSADARNVNVGSGSMESDVSTSDGSTAGLREPATKGRGVREEVGVGLSGVGRQGKEGLKGLPEDAKSK